MLLVIIAIICIKKFMKDTAVMASLIMSLKNVKVVNLKIVNQ
jgi:hypothetical protein